MPFQLVEITKPGIWLTKYRGFLHVNQKHDQVTKIVLDDIAAVIIGTKGCTITTELIASLAKLNIPLVTCDEYYLPSSWLIPVNGNSRQFSTQLIQSSVTQPVRKQLWKQIIIQKIVNQMKVLEKLGLQEQKLSRFVKEVKSGDQSNIEAQAAKVYWREIFGNEFRRNRSLEGVNSYLNYGYTIMRSSLARSVVSTGLNPCASLHHKNPQNAFNLVDDLIEPFRPFIDYKVFRIFENKPEIKNLDVDGKRSLAQILTTRISWEGRNETSSMSSATRRLSLSLIECYSGKSKKLELPKFEQKVISNGI